MKPVAGALGLILGLVCGPAQALLATCTVSATTVAFGSYNPFNASNTDSTGTISVACSGLGVLVNYTIKLSTGGSGSYSPRRMSSGGNTLNYNLYTTSGRTTTWGDGTGGTGTISDGYTLSIGTTTRPYTVYGRVPALQNVRSGAYTDTITVTVDY